MKETVKNYLCTAQTKVYRCFHVILTPGAARPLPCKKHLASYLNGEEGIGPAACGARRRYTLTSSLVGEEWEQQFRRCYKQSKDIFTKLKEELTLPRRRTGHKPDPLSN